MASDKGAGHPRPDGKAEEERVVGLRATTTTPPGGMRGPASRAAIVQGSPGPEESEARMDGIHDVGGMHGFGQMPELTDAPPFAEPWEGKAFVIGALAARISGTNLHAFRHAIERVPPREYMVGYWNRWTIGAQLMMED